MPSRATILSGLMLGASLAAMPSIAFAQQGADSAPDIIVTATRRAAGLEDVPIAVAVISGDALQKAGVTSTQGLEQVTPGLVMAQSATSFQPTIRGVGTRNTTAGEESNVALYLDGVYQPAMTSNMFELLNVERVEVLKGPQGTLFGRNATGGAINIITKKPSDEPAMTLLASYGSYGETRVATYATVPIVPTLSADVAAQYHDTNGYVDDLIRGGKLGYQTDYNVRGRVRWQPSAAVDIIAGVNYVEHSDTVSFAVQPIANNTNGRRPPNVVVLPTKPWQYAGNIFPLVETDQLAGTLTAAFDLGFASLELASDYQRNRSLLNSDSDGVAAQTQSPFAFAKLLTKSFSQEARLISQSTGPLEWIAGAMYFDMDAQTNPTLSGTTVIRGRQLGKSYAVFGEGTLRLFDKLFLTAGARYSYEKRTVYPFVNVPGTPASANFDSVDPRFSIRYELSDNNSIYLTYSTGFKSGTYNATSATAILVQPEEIKAFEGGVKLRPAPGVRFEASAFHYDYRNMQVPARLPAGTTTVLTNAAKSKIKGIETSLDVTPVSGLNLKLAGAYTDGKYSDFPGAQITLPVVNTAGVPIGGNSQINRDLKGNRMIRSPKWSGTAYANYAFDAAGGRIDLNANANYSSGYYADFLNRIRQDEYVLVNLSASWTDPEDRYKLSVWGNNVLDEAVYSYTFTSVNGDFTSYRPPATYGVTLQLKFGR